MSTRVMVRLEGSEDRPALRSVYSPDRQFTLGTIVRLENFGGWPEFEIIERAEDGTLTLRPAVRHERDPPS